MEQSEDTHGRLGKSEVDCNGEAGVEIGKINAEVNALPADPTPQAPMCLTLSGLEAHRYEGLKLATVETLCERLKIVTESQIAETLKKHHEELCSDIRMLMKGEGRHEHSREDMDVSVSHVDVIKAKPRTTSMMAQKASIDAIVDQSDDKPRPQLSKGFTNMSVSEPHVRPSVARIAKNIFNSQRTFEDRVKQQLRQQTLQKMPDPETLDDDDKEAKEEQLSETNLKRCLHHPGFELAMGIAVCTNAIFIGCEIEYMTAHPYQIVPPLELMFISYAYTTVFVLELSLRLWAGWWGFIWRSELKNLAWNYLDITIVAASLVEVALDIISYQGSSNGSVDLSNLRVIRMVRVFRLIRLLRIARFVRFVRALRMLVFSIVCTLKSVFWAMVLMAVIIYVFAILFTQATVSYNTIESLNPTIPYLEHYWGTIGRSMFSLFMSISGGISWGEVIEPLGSISPTWQVLFLVYIYFTYFAILNVVTGIFCQAALESCSEDHDSMLQTVLRHKQIYTERFMEIFSEIDKDKSGKITMDEFVLRMEDDDVKDYFASLELHCADALCLFDLFEDAEEEGIRVDEFVMGCLRLKGTARSSDMVRLLHENRLLFDYLNSLLAHFDINSSTKSKQEGAARAAGVFMEKSAKEVASRSSSTKQQMLKLAND